MDTIRQVQDRVVETNRVNGWHDRFDAVKATDPDAAVEHIIVKLALIGTEAAEAIEDVRDRGVRALTEPLTHTEPAGWLEGNPRKPDGIGVELADVVIRALDTAGMLSINLGAVIEQKLTYNATRGKHHGGKAA